MRRSVKMSEPESHWMRETDGRHWMTETELIKRRSIMNDEMCGYRNETAAAQLGIMCMTRCSTGDKKYFSQFTRIIFQPLEQKNILVTLPEKYFNHFIRKIL